MLMPEPNPLDDEFARLLAAHDERLLTGKDEPIEEISPVLAPRLVQAQAFIELLDGAWRRQHGLADTSPQQSGAADLTPLDELPAAVGRFKIERELGRGGGGVVYLAHDPALGRQVALKVPRLEIILTPALRRRFLREGQASALLNHPNIIPIHEAGAAASVCYIVASYCPGPNLAQWLRDHAEPVAPSDAALLIERLAEAMAHAHERGILHRDLKPSNILLERVEVNGGAVNGPLSNPGSSLAHYQPRIADFGLAKMVLDADDATSTGMLLGTAAYMAPEQTRGAKDVGAPCDLWSLGVILYEVLTRHKPCPGGTSLEIMQAIQTADPVSPRRLRPDVPRDLETICLKCLEKVPEKRYANAAALAADLRRFQRQEPIKARPTGFFECVLKSVRRRPARAALLALCCVSAALLAGGFAWYDFLHRTHLEELQDERTQLQAEQASRHRDLSQRAYLAKFGQAWQEWNRNVPQRTLELLAALAPDRNDEDRRGFECFFLLNRAQHAPKQLEPMGSSAYALALAPDAKLLAVGRNSGELTLWDTSTWKKTGALTANTGPIYLLAFSPDGTLLAAAGTNGQAKIQLKLYDVVRQTALADLSGDLEEALFGLAFSPDGMTLAATSNRLLLFDTKPPKLRAKVQLGNALDYPAQILWSPGLGGPTVGSYEGDLMNCDGNTGKVLESWSTGTPISALARSPDGKALALGGPKGVTFHPAKKLLEQSAVVCMVYRADSGLLAAGGRDGRICLWDAKALRLLDKFTGVSDKHMVDRLTAKGYDNSYLVRSLALMPDGKTLISGGDDGLVNLWDISAPELSCLLTGDLKEPWLVTFTPDGQTVIAGDDACVRLWDAQTKRALHVLRAPVTAGTVSRDGKLLATADAAGTIQLWDITADRAKRPKNKPLAGHQGGVLTLDISLDGRTLASGGEDGTVRLWDTATGAQRRLLLKEPQPIFAVAFHPDGKLLATGGSEMVVKLWDVDTGKILHSRLEGERVRCLRYARDGALLAVGLATRTGDGTVTLVRGDTLEELARLHGHTGVVRALAFTPDGTRLATGADDHLIKLWHVATGQELLTIYWHKGLISSLAFAPDGQTLASASHDGSVRLWFGPK